MPNGRHHRRRQQEEHASEPRGKDSMVLVPASELEALRRSIDALREEVRQATRPALVSPTWLAWKYDCSVQTVMRNVQAWDLRKFDPNGQLKKDNSGPVRISLIEYEAGKRLSTRKTTNQVRREQLLERARRSS